MSSTASPSRRSSTLEDTRGHVEAIERLLEQRGSEPSKLTTRR